ncbi:hypothetical protein NQ317_009785 [Molorchus minor]|uniref:Uncharacterized protein n=1 Tax=Molorchus minor TaxID=1323400 RepID=A0ABQ9IS37_9CUCU|nr:hypothetical protein NQ317_009785 [Molorchus minor]
MKQQHVNEASVQVDEDFEERRLLNKMSNFSSYVIENTSRFSDEMLPPQNPSTPNNLEYLNQSPNWEQQSNQTTKSESESNTNSLPLNWNFTNNTKPQTASTSSSSVCLEKKFDTLSPEENQKTRQEYVQEEQPRKGDKKVGECSNEQTIILPLSSLHNLNGRKNYLEQRVKHLQMCIKQQHYCSEQTLQHYWHQFRGERADLHAKLRYLQEKLDQQVRISNEQLDKLERTDLLVKDLYIENAYLIASVQRLEQQCHMMAQCNSSSSSV